MDLIFIKQIGVFNFLLRGLIVKLLRKIKKNNFEYKTLSGKNYNIYNWDPSGAEVFLTQCFTDWGNEYLFLDSLKDRKKGIFLDIGCHSGYYSILFDHYFHKIIGFEPSSKCIEILSNLKSKKFHAFQLFVGDKDMEVKSKEYPNGYSFYGDTFTGKDFKIKNLSQISLDNFCQKENLNNITAIKIDVDGIDLKVLYGAYNLINSNRPSIMIENYSKELFQFFNDKKYSIFTLTSDKKKPYNLELEEMSEHNPAKWVKMVCCIPNEYKKSYNRKIFKGNFFTGINKKRILKTFNVYF